MNASSRSLRPVDLDRVDLDGLAERARTLRSRVVWRAMRRAARAAAVRLACHASPTGDQRLHPPPRGRLGMTPERTRIVREARQDPHNQESVMNTSFSMRRPVYPYRFEAALRRAAWTRVARAVASAVARLKTRQTIRQLSALSDRELFDIGLLRAEIQDVASRMSRD